MLRGGLTLNKASSGSCSEDVAFKVWLRCWGRASLVTGGWASSAKNSRAPWEALSWAVKAPGDGEADQVMGQLPAQWGLERGLGHGQEHWVSSRGHGFDSPHQYGSSQLSQLQFQGIQSSLWPVRAPVAHMQKTFFYYLYSEVWGLSTGAYRPWHHIGVVRKFSSLIFNTMAIVLVLRSPVYPG